MEKRKWLWKRRSSSEKSPGESESSGSLSSQYERCSDDQEAAKGSPNHNNQSPEVTLRAPDGPSCLETGKPNGLLQKLSDADKDNGPHCNVMEKEMVPDKSRKEATSNATSNGSLDQESVEVISVSTTNRSLNQDSQSVEATSIATLNRSSNPVSQSEEATSIIMSNNSSNQDCRSVEASLKRREENESVKLLTEKLSAALVNVSLKDELVKQHSRVAEEAVAGWEKAEKEVAGLKQQLEATLQQKTAIEARVSHLDEALKECVRQLRLAKEEQGRKVSHALAEKTCEFDLTKSKLEAQLIEVQAQLEASSRRAKSAPLVDTELLQKLKYSEEENIALKHKLLSQSEELKVRTIERDLSIKAAETASKQHLESIKKVAKLEAECRRLKKNLSAHKQPANNSDQSKFATASNSCVESVTTDSQSENGDLLNALEIDSHKKEKTDLWANALIAKLDQFKNEKAGFSRHSLPVSSSVEIDLMDDFLEMERLASMPQNGHHQQGHQHESETKPTSNLENQLSNKLRIMMSGMAELEEKVEKVEAEKGQMEITLSQTQMCLEKSQVELIETRMKSEQLVAELQEANELKQDLESNMNDLKLEAQAMSLKIKLLYEEMDRQRIFSEELSTKCQELESDLERKKEELELHHQNIAFKDELEKKEMALAESQKCLEASHTQLIEIKAKLEQLEMELEEVYGSKEQLESELNSTREEGQRLSANVNSLQAQIDKEQALSAELSIRCQGLENKLLQKKQELALLRNAHSNNEQKIKQEDLATAAGKLAECQETIASLGNQLMSLATLEDFLIDTASITGFSGYTPMIAKGAGGETWKFHSNNVYLPKKEIGAFSLAPQEEDGELHTFSKYTNGLTSESSSSSASLLFAPMGSEESVNLFRKSSSPWKS